MGPFCIVMWHKNGTRPTSLPSAGYGAAEDFYLSGPVEKAIAGLQADLDAPHRPNGFMTV